MNKKSLACYKTNRTKRENINMLTVTTKIQSLNDDH